MNRLMARTGRLRALLSGCLLTLLPMSQGQSQTYSSYATGHISRVSVEASDVVVMLDVGVPSNCTGTPFGWLMIKSSSAPLVAFVLGLWMRGDAAQKQLTVYTTGIDSSGYCQISQIDTGSAG